MAKKRRFKKGVTVTESIIIINKNGEPVWVLDENGLNPFNPEIHASADGGEPIDEEGGG
jgi:hypothetical protein